VIVDFHSHTSESDGTLNPQALADLMAERGVAYFSISDHDTMSAYGRFVPANGARVVTGVEINTTYRGNEVHILGYGITAGAPEFAALLERNQAARYERIQRVVMQLRRAGYGITLDDVLAQGREAKALGRPHVAKALIVAGIAPDVDWAFRRLLRGGMPGYVPSLHVTPQKAIEAILLAGGVPVLAHPGRLKDRALIDELVPCGLRGLEVFYPQHDSLDVEILRDVARRHKLVMTAGMDFHDIRYHTAGVGIEVEREEIEPFLELVGLA
jgi:3',5'-nucleoside bisphosphate phosphatase